MSFFRYCLLILVLAAATVIVVACKREATEEPLLLLENGNNESDLPPAIGPVADNSRCHVCHINYEDEQLAVMHARANIGCEQCHGASDEHCSDEDNITAPGIMYPVEEINSFCLGCHPKDKIAIDVHKGVLSDTGTKEENCTDCHGEHRLNYRTRKWDKRTGKLIEDDKVRMLSDEKIE